MRLIFIYIAGLFNPTHNDVFPEIMEYFTVHHMIFWNEDVYNDPNNWGKDVPCYELAHRYFFYNTSSKLIKLENLTIVPYDHSKAMKCPFKLTTWDFWTDFQLDSVSDVGMCVIPIKMQCDGFATCLTDECDCANISVFHCVVQPGCVPFEQVCDGKNAECYDLSDECLCQGVVELICNNKTVMCVTPERFCLLYDREQFEAICHAYPPVNCAEMGKNITALYSEVYKWNPVSNCLADNHENVSTMTPFDLKKFCERNCSIYYGNQNWQQYCKYISHGSPNFFKFSCSNFSDSLPFNYNDDDAGLEIICDNKNDCQNNVDEMGCPGRFYCESEQSSTSTVSIDNNLQCDNIKQCPNGRDECIGCDFGVITSSESLLKSLSTAMSCLVFGVAIILLNLRNSFITLRQLFCCQNISKSKLIDTFLCFKISLYDLLMGMYLLLIAIANFVLRSKGGYCESSHQWRSSIFCDILGVLFSFSSHGSLLTVSLMSIIRGIKCTVTFVTIRYRTVVRISSLLSILNLVHSVVPVLKIQVLQNIFVSEVHLDNILENPLIQYYNETHVRKIYQAFYPNGSAGNVMEMLENLSSITSLPHIFDYTVIGYYGTSPLCIQNIFKNQESYRLYKLSFCTNISILLAFVAISYIAIISRQLKSPKAEAKDLIVKVAMIIGSQLLCWVSLIALANYYIGTSSAPSYLFEVFALLAIPFNSFVNPIFYSDIYKVILKWFAVVKVWFRTSHCEAAQNKDEMEMQTVQNMSVTQDITIEEN